MPYYRKHGEAHFKWKKDISSLQKLLQEEGFRGDT